MQKGSTLPEYGPFVAPAYPNWRNCHVTPNRLLRTFVDTKLNYMASIQKITPFLWFDQQAAEAVAFYVAAFPHSRIISANPMVVEFELNGQAFKALNGGPMFQFTEAISFFVECDGQEEVDHYWNYLISEGGQESQCGWLKDKYGLSWQIVPRQFMEYASTGTPEQTQRVMAAMMKMNKMIVADFEQAWKG